MLEDPVTSLSESMQMYIVTIARLWEDHQPVPLSKLAEVFMISPVSVNEMCRKLQDNGLVNYQPYKGASLTPEGEEKAKYIIRRHRLWEVFLTEKLSFENKEAHEIACQLEHATTDLLADRLDAFLEYPSVTPSGEPIPKSDGVLSNDIQTTLDLIGIGQNTHVYRCDVDEITLAYLQRSGIRPGVKLSLMASSNDGLLIRMEDGKVSTLSRDLAKSIIVFVTKGEDNAHDHQDQSSSMESSNTKEVIKMENIKIRDIPQNAIQRVNLDTLRVGQRGIVIGVGGKGQVRQRMLDMGLVPGSEIEVIRVAPLGDPVEFSIKGYHLSLRKSEAKEIIVEVTE